MNPNSLDFTWAQQFGLELMGDHGGVPRSASSKRETDRGTGGLRTHNDMTARLDANTHLHLDAHVDLDRCFQRLLF